MIVQEVVVPGYGWTKGEAGRFNRGGGEGLRSHISRIWVSNGHVTSTTKTWLSLSLRDSAESPNRVMVASQAYLSWATFLEEENRKCHFELQFVFVVVGLD